MWSSHFLFFFFFPSHVLDELAAAQFSQDVEKRPSYTLHLPARGRGRWGEEKKRKKQKKEAHFVAAIPSS